MPARSKVRLRPRPVAVVAGCTVRLHRLLPHHPRQAADRQPSPVNPAGRLRRLHPVDPQPSPAATHRPRRELVPQAALQIARPAVVPVAAPAAAPVAVHMAVPRPTAVAAEDERRIAWVGPGSARHPPCAEPGRLDPFVGRFACAS